MSELSFNVGAATTDVKDKNFDLIIVGAGPAGYTAAIYATRYKMKTLILAETFGGLAADASTVENYPGLMGLSGFELMEKFRDHAIKLGTQIKQASVVKIEKKEDLFYATTSSGETFTAKTVILALGTRRRHLNIPGEDKFSGKGVSYCATCDAAFYKDKVVGVVGGSDSAAQAALLLSRYASKVYILYRRDKLRAEPSYVSQIEQNSKIEVVYNVNVTELKGNEHLETVVLDNGKELKIDGLFVEIGGIPSTELAKSIGVNVNERGFIIVNSAMETNVKGVYAAGDVTTGSNGLEQIITACAEGAIAAESAYKFERKLSSDKVMRQYG